MNNRLIAEKVRKARGSMSLREFAQRCDISHTYLDCIEKNYDPRTGKEVRITLETLEKLSKGTGYSLNELLGTIDTTDTQKISEPSNLPIPDVIVYKGKSYTVDDMPPEVRAFIDMIGKTYLEKE